MSMLETPISSVIRTIYEIRARCNGAPQPFFDTAPTLNQARAIADEKAKALKLPAVELDWKQDFRDVKDDGVFVCEIRRDESQMGHGGVWI
jgi:hypothetical protein